MEPGKGQEKGSAARCHTSLAAAEEEGWAPSPRPQALRDSMEHSPMVGLLPPPSPILSPLGATCPPLHTGTSPHLPCCLPHSGGWWEGWGGQSTLGTTRDTFYLCLKTLKLILETMIITHGQGCRARGRDSREGTAPWPAW